MITPRTLHEFNVKHQKHLKRLKAVLLRRSRKALDSAWRKFATR